MKLEQQVCSLELAKKLKELGVKQESAFYWTFPKNDAAYAAYIRAYLQAHTIEKNWLDGMIRKVSAFTVAELGKMLPIQIKTGKGLHGITKRTSFNPKGYLGKWRSMAGHVLRCEVL